MKSLGTIFFSFKVVVRFCYILHFLIRVELVEVDSHIGSTNPPVPLFLILNMDVALERYKGMSRG